MAEALGLRRRRRPRRPPPPAVAAVAPALSVYLCVRGAPAAIDFYREAFGAVETMRMTGDDGRVGHAEITLEGTTVMLADEHPEIGVVSPETLGGTPVSLYLHVADVDATYARAVAAGATGERPPADQFHGNRNASLRDPFGHRWMITQPIEAVSVEEMAAASARLHRHRGGPARARHGSRPRSASSATSPCRRPTSPGPRPSTPRCSAGTSSRRGRAATAGPTATSTTRRCPSASTTPWTTRARTTTTGSRTSQAMIVRVRELGGEVLAVDEYASGGSARCRDDQGVEFDLWQAAPGLTRDGPGDRRAQPAWSRGRRRL